MKKKQGVNWGVLVFVFLLLIAAVFGYSFIQFYQGTQYPASVQQPGHSNSPSNQPGDSNPGSGSESGKAQEGESEEDPDIALYQTKLSEMENTIGKIDSSLTNVLRNLTLSVSDRSIEEKELEIFEGLPLRWKQVKGAIKIPSGKYTVTDVSNRVVEAVEQVGGTLIRVEQTKGGQTVYLGLLEGDQEVITHQYKLTIEEKRPQQIPQPPKKVEGKGKLAFVIDDLGYEWSEFDRMMTIPRPMTFAVIPHLPYSTRQAQKALEKGYDLIVHQPMEPSTNNNPGPGAIYTKMTEEEIIKVLSDNLSSLPKGIIGANNHMGSKATSDARVMDVVLRFYRDRGLFFVDSHTSPNSVVAEVAREVGESFGENRIFLDNVDELEPIKEQIRKAARIAIRDGYAITIGHVRKYTARAILAMIDEIEAMGVEIVPAKTLLEEY